MIFRRDVGLLDSTLADAPHYPIGDFAVRAVGKPHVLGPTGAIRQPLAVLYGRTPWSRIYLEVSPPEGGSADMERLEILPPSPELTVFGPPLQVTRATPAARGLQDRSPTLPQARCRLRAGPES